MRNRRLHNKKSCVGVSSYLYNLLQHSSSLLHSMFSVFDGIWYFFVSEISISVYLQGCYDKMVGWFKDNSVYVIGSFSAILTMEVRSAIYSIKLVKKSVLRHLSSKMTFFEHVVCYENNLYNQELTLSCFEHTV